MILDNKLNFQELIKYILTFLRGRPGFYMITASVMKELNKVSKTIGLLRKP